MGTSTPPKEQPSLPALLDIADMMPMRKFTREEFYAMDRAGIFDHDYGVELVDGRIITRMAPIGGEHAWSVENLTRMLVSSVTDPTLGVRVQSAISLPADRELQPDFIVYERRPQNAHDNPNPDQVRLVVEVADSSLRYDRNAKMMMYAEAAIPEYWVVDVAHKCVFIYTEPQDGGYAHLEQRSGDEKLTVCGSDFKVSDIF